MNKPLPETMTETCNNYDFLLRIDEKEYLKSLLSGHIYMKRAWSFRDYNGSIPGVGDKNEGLAKLENVEKITLTSSQGESLTLHPLCPVAHKYSGYFPLWCSYHLKIDASLIGKDETITFPKEFLEGLSIGRKNPAVIFISKRHFENRVFRYAEDKNIICIGDDVAYRDLSVEDPDFQNPYLAFFRKDKKYAAQKEWRLLFANSSLNPNEFSHSNIPYEFDIGDMSNFSHIVDLSLLKNDVTIKIRKKYENIVEDNGLEPDKQEF